MRRSVKMKKTSLSRRAKELSAKVDRSFMHGGIAMLPAGILLVISAIVRLRSGDYTIGWNLTYSGFTGPAVEVMAGFVFACLGGVFLWLTIRGRAKPPEPPDENAPS